MELLEDNKSAIARVEERSEARETHLAERRLAFASPPARLPLSSSLYPSVSSVQHEQDFVTKLQVDRLFGKLELLEKDLKHYDKLRRRWNGFKNVLHYAKYPLGALMIGGDAALFLTGVGVPLAVASSALTLAELVGGCLLEDSLVRAKLERYARKIAHLKEWIDRMYVFKEEALRDGLLDQKEIELWNRLVAEYGESREKPKERQTQEPPSLKQLQDQIALLSKQIQSRHA